jgi:streptogramin lyase
MSTTTYGPSISVGNVQLNNVYATTDLISQACSLAPSTSNAAVITQWIQKTISTRTTPGQILQAVDTGTNAFILGAYKTGTGISNSTDSPFSSGTTGSLYLNGTLGAYAITSTSLVFSWGTIGFTLECWVKYNSFANAGGLPSLFGNMTASNAALLYWGFGAINSGALALYYYNGAGIQISTTATIPVGQWTSIAISCDTINIYLFIGGVLSLTTALSGTPQVSTSLPFEFCQGINVNLPSVYVANIRYTRGAALYTSTYTPSTAPLGASPSGTTVLLVDVPKFSIRSPPFWSNAVTFATTSTAPGSAAFNGCCLTQDGRVVFAPYNAGYVGVFNPMTNIFTSILANPPCNGGGYAVGAVLCPDGRILFVPYNGATNAPVTLWNPVNNVLTTVATGITGTAKFQGGCVLPDGRVLLAPNVVTGVGVFNPVTNSFLTYGTVPSGAYGGGCCLIPDGRVVFSPSGQTNIGIFNYLTNSYTTATWGFTGAGYAGATLVPDGRVVFTPNGQANVGVFNPATNSFATYNTGFVVNYQGSCLLPDGRVVFAPLSQTSGSIGLFNPYTNSFSTIIIAPTGTPYAGGCVLLPDGRVIFTPYNALNVGVLAGGAPAPSEFCLHPFFNKT